MHFLPQDKFFAKFKAPYDNQSTIDSITVVNVEDIMGDDVYRIAYEPLKRTREDMVTDKNDGATLLKLKHNNTIVYVPTNYIDIIPNGTYTPYHRVMLTVNLGAIPTNENLQSLVNEIKVITLNTTGIVADTNLIVTSSDDVYVKTAEHTVKDLNRKMAKVSTANTTLELIKSNIRIKELEDELNDLRRSVMHKLDA